MPHKRSSSKSAILLMFLVLSISTLGQGGTNTWALTASMSTARQRHAANLLTDGRVLVSGGFNVASAEIYEPATGTWSLTGAMSTIRSAHASTLLSDGRVLVSGGVAGNNFWATAEIYDPVLGTWLLTGTMSAARRDHTATLMSDGRVLVSGGVGGNVLTAVEIYDPVSGTWSITSPMSVGRTGHTATLLSDGRVLVSGGFGNLQYLASAEIYDPLLGTWSVTSPMSIGRELAMASLLSDGRVLVSGGQSDVDAVATAEIYDPLLGTWSLTGAMSIRRAAHRAAELPDGRVLISGGGNNANGSTASAEVYDPALGTWSLTAPMSALRSFHTATTLPDGSVLVSGGQGGGATAEVFSLDDPTPPQVSCGAADGAWHDSDLTISCSASDPESGLANAGDANFTLATNVSIGTETDNAPTNSREVCNSFGQCTTAGPIAGNKVDKKSPAVLCGASDGAWHNGDAAVGCTASDSGSGLANAADTSFTLTTNVPVGTENANAATGTRQVCDNVGACSTTGPIIGNKVDKKPPAITVSSPAPNATYQLNASVAASYACVDGGSGVASCQGPVANGSPIETSSTGTKTFSVTATDAVGNPSTVTATYTVVSGGGAGQTSADLGLKLAAPAKVSPGGTLTYQIAVANAGKVTATGVVVSNPLPAGTVFASSSSSQGTVTAPAVGSNGTVTVNLGSLANGATTTISIVVTVTAASGTVLIDTATVTATSQDLNSNNNSATQKTTVSKN